MARKSYEARVTAKGQTTIPVEVREHLKVAAGDSIQFVLVDDHYEVVPRNRPAASLFGRLQAYAIKGTSLEDYRGAVTDYFADPDGHRGDKDEAA